MTSKSCFLNYICMSLLSQTYRHSQTHIDTHRDTDRHIRTHIHTPHAHTPTPYAQTHIHAPHMHAGTYEHTANNK